MTQDQGPLTETKEIALAPGVFAHLQDTTKGAVRTYVGSTLINQTGQEQPVLYSHQNRVFEECTLSNAIRKMAIAEEGDYLVLENPGAANSHPNLAEAKQDCPHLRMGSKVNAPGPCQFALWPGQHATLVPGHNLRSNQFLVVRVYNERSATENWKEATIRKVEPAAKVEPDTPDEELPGTEVLKQIRSDLDRDAPDTLEESTEFIAGQRIIIRGDRVSFFIPPTGMEVVVGPDSEYVREAVTLEQLEYCILVDEDGNKRYERGPQVVFPAPTEVFLEADEKRKFRAYELNQIQGLHIKVIAEYTVGNKVHKEGEELFLTGEDQPIYFPRPEHSIIKYGDLDKHYAVAIPPGEGRYVMNRLTGEIETRRGADMLLCDPRTEVIVKRVLTQRQAELWYPGNIQVVEYNRDLAAMAFSNRTSSRGYVDTPEAVVASPGIHRTAAMATAGLAASRPREEAAGPTIADEFSRGTSFTPPRTITLDSKFEGVPPICPWTGYAIRIVDKSGKRRTVIGPDAILLNFDEELEVLTLSTGKPKTTDNVKKTVYLRVKNNKISDVVENVYTADHVPLDLKLSFTVDFEDSPDAWFDVENPIKLLTDHVRSVLKGRIRKLGIKEFWAAGADFVRDFVLGEAPETGSRPGMVFKQNGMRITDVEILDTRIKNADIGSMLQRAEEEVVANNIELERAERELETLQRKEAITRDRRTAEHDTAGLVAKLRQALVEMDKITDLARQEAAAAVYGAEQVAITAEEAVTDTQAEALLTREKAEARQEAVVADENANRELKQLNAETEAVKERFSVLQEGFTEALTTLSNQDTMTKIAQAGSIQQMLGGNNLVDVLGQILGGSTGRVPAAFKRALASVTGAADTDDDKLDVLV